MQRYKHQRHLSKLDIMHIHMCSCMMMKMMVMMMMIMMMMMMMMMMMATTTTMMMMMTACFYLMNDVYLHTLYAAFSTTSSKLNSS